MAVSSMFIGDVTDRFGATKFVEWCFAEIGLCWHPDGDFADYVDAETGEPCFKPADASQLNRVNAQCFDLLGDELYEIAEAVMHSEFHVG